MRSFALAALLAGSVALAALGAEVKKKDGTVVAGEIVAEDEDGVTLRHRLGEARIARADIQSIDRGASQSVEERLEKIKADTIERLKDLADAASAEKRKDAAQALRDAIEDVRKWSARPQDPRPEEPAAASAPAPAEPRPADFVDILRRWEKLKSDPRATSAARDQFCAEMSRKLARVTLKVVDVSRCGGGYVVRGTTSGGATVAASFEDPGDGAKLLKLKPGVSISATGTMRIDSNATDLQGCRLR